METFRRDRERKQFQEGSGEGNVLRKIFGDANSRLWCLFKAPLQIKSLTYSLTSFCVPLTHTFLFLVSVYFCVYVLWEISISSTLRGRAHFESLADEKWRCLAQITNCQQITNDICSRNSQHTCITFVPTWILANCCFSIHREVGQAVKRYWVLSGAKQLAFWLIFPGAKWLLG